MNKKYKKCAFGFDARNYGTKCRTGRHLGLPGHFTCESNAHFMLFSALCTTLIILTIPK